MQNLQHPLYEKDYRPTEVVSLASILPKPKNIYEMASAEILGDKPRNTDLDQKPTLYSTVVVSHPTSVIHPTKPLGNAIITDSAVADQFGGLERQLPPGSFASPVKIANLNLNDKGFGEMEKPIFISKGQKTVTESQSEDKNVPMLGNTQAISNEVVKASQLDATTVKARLKALKNNERFKKLNILIKTRDQLKQDAKLLRKGVQKETSDLLSAKSSSLNLSIILKNYEERLRKDKVAHLKLADRVLVKNQLKNKLIKEIQGFRTRPSDYKELLNVDKTTVKAVVQSIRSQLESQHH
jgi:hypothetical protein